MDEATLLRLHRAAVAVRANAHAPYSRFHVGAAVLLDDGEVVVGTNMENASYGLSLCAEALALGAVAAAGRLAAVAGVLVTGGLADAEGPGEPVTPCGRCRQLLAEVAQIAGRDFPVVATDLSGTARLAHPVGGWLPHAFGLGAPA